MFAGKGGDCIRSGSRSLCGKEAITTQGLQDEYYTGSGVRCLPLDVIITRQNVQPPDESIIRQMAASIRREGLLSPVAVEEIGNGQYRLIDGEKRIAAFRMLGYTSIDAELLPTTVLERTAGEIMDALADGRLHYLEQAEAFRRLACDFGIRSDMLAAMLNIPQEVIAQKQAFLALDEELRAYILRHNLPEAQAIQLLRLPAGDQRCQLARQAVEGGLCSRDVELLARSMLMRLPEQPGRAVSAVRDHRLFANAIRDMVEQLQSSGVPASCDERREGASLVLTVRLPIRRSRKGMRNSEFGMRNERRDNME